MSEKDFRKYVLNFLPSPEDERDYKLPFAFGEIQEVELKDIPIIVKDQGSIGMCVACASSYTREIVEYLQNKKIAYKQFSEGFIYGNREETDYQGEGMYFREALKNLRKYGAVIKEDFPLVGLYPDVKKAVEERKEELYKKAELYKITYFFRISSPYEVIASLQRNMPVLLGIPVYDSFYEIGKDGIAKMPDEKNEKLNGYHALTIVGVKKFPDKYYYKVLNSWGNEWGDNGYCYLPLDYPFIEMWTMTDEILPPPPDNKKNEEKKDVIYAIQIGIYLRKAYAENKIKQLKNLGYIGAYIVEYKDSKGQLCFKVYYGKYTKKEDALVISSGMLAKKIPNKIVEF